MLVRSSRSSQSSIVTNRSTYLQLMAKSISTKIIILILALSIVQSMVMVKGSSMEKSSSSMAQLKQNPTSGSSSTSSQSLNGKPSGSSMNSVNTINSGSSSSSTGALLKPLMSTFMSTTSANGVPNPYPFRTMIGNLMFRLRQHRTQMLLIPSVIRIVYQYRRPIGDGLSSAYQSLVAESPALASSASAAGSSGARISGSSDMDDSESSNSNGGQESDPMMTSSSNPYLQMLLASSPGHPAHQHQVPIYNLMAAAAYQEALQQAAAYTAAAAAVHPQPVSPLATLYHPSSYAPFAFV